MYFIPKRSIRQDRAWRSNSNGVASGNCHPNKLMRL
jgi:hypothetical protein